MKRRTKIMIVAAGSAAVLAAGGAGAAFAGGTDDTEKPITGSALQKAGEAALGHTGGGKVTETEAGDEDSYYEVEVTLDDGKQVDVQLDENFTVLSSENDDESENEADEK
jgi:uncharacterized membrane protein YkoI